LAGQAQDPDPVDTSTWHNAFKPQRTFAHAFVDLQTHPLLGSPLHPLRQVQRYPEKVSLHLELAPQGLDKH